MKTSVQRVPGWARGNVVRLIACAVLVTAGLALVRPAEAKRPGRTYCFNEICHRVLTLEAVTALIGRETVHETSYYDNCRQDIFNPCGLTSSGEIFRPGRPDNAASPIYPDGTTLLVFNPESGKAAVLRVNNAGPYWGRRKLDVSRATAERLGFRKRGIARLQVMVIGAPTELEARYHRRRRYDSVPGPIGEYRSLDEARRAISSSLFTASTRFTGMRFGGPPDPARPAQSDEAPREDHQEQVLGTTMTVAALSPPGTLSRLVRPFQTASLPEPRLAPMSAETIDGARVQARDPGTIELAALQFPAEAPALLRQLPVETPHTSAAEAAPPLSTEPNPDAPDDLAPGGTGPVAPARSPTPLPPAVSASDGDEHDADARGPADTSVVLVARSSADIRPVDVVATRRLDILGRDVQAQPVLPTMALETAADVMERDVLAGRVSLFAANIPLKTLPPQSVGRLGLFARAARETPTIWPRSGPAGPGFEARIPDAVRRTGSQVSAVADPSHRESSR